MAYAYTNSQKVNLSRGHWSARQPVAMRLNFFYKHNTCHSRHVPYPHAYLECNSSFNLFLKVNSNLICKVSALNWYYKWFNMEKYFSYVNLRTKVKSKMTPEKSLHRKKQCSTFHPLVIKFTFTFFIKLCYLVVPVSFSIFAQRSTAKPSHDLGAGCWFSYHAHGSAYCWMCSSYRDSRLMLMPYAGNLCICNTQNVLTA